MEISEYLTTVKSIHEEARRRGVSFQVAEDEELRGRSVRLNGRELTAFTSCSYLGLEYHPALIEGTVDAVRRYGTQFSSSRGYMSAPLYRELEDHLTEIFGGHPLIASSTSLGHQMVLPVIATEKDAIVVDNQAHRSLQIAATLAQANGATVETVRHRELDGQALEAVERLARKHRTVYFACDGVYSMYGDCAPFGLLQQILDVAPNVRLYVDDAHGMSWAGEHGRGFFLSRMPLSERIVLATSFAKAYAAGGACFVFADEEEREKVRLTGGPYVFSGPMQPPMMGAAIASARIHLSDEIVQLQQTYRDRINLCNVLLREHDLPLLCLNEGPINFLRMGKVEAAIGVAERLQDEGYYVTISTYPAVPTKRAGIRLTITAAHSPEEIRGVVEALAYHVPRVLEEHHMTRDELDHLFRNALPGESWGGLAPGAAPRRARGAAGLAGIVVHPGKRRLPAGWSVEVKPSIRDIDPQVWNPLMGAHGVSSWDALATAEDVFRGHPRPEHDSDFRYLIVRGEDERPVAATYFTRCLMKDDMFMRHEVSEEVERFREDDPYFLTTQVLALGSMFSEGRHLYLDRAGPWQQALAVVVDELSRAAEEMDASAVILRDLAGDDPEVDAWMQSHDFVKVPVLDSYRVDLEGRTEEDMLAAASTRTRRFLRRLIGASAPYRTHILGAHGEPVTDPGMVDHLYRLYRNVASRRMWINIFPMPQEIVPAVLDSAAWEVVAVTLDPAAGGPEDGRPVAWGACYRHGDEYTPFLCGVDYRYVEGQEFGAYRQLLLAVLRRARELGARTLHWGMDAGVEKGRFGAEPRSTCAYFLSRDHDHGERLHEIVTTVGLRTVSAA